MASSAIHLEPLGITPREYSVLAVVAESFPLSQTSVAEILGLDRTTILKLGASLERHGLLVRERDPDDKRAYAVALTPSGDRLRAQAFELLLDCERRFLAPLNRSDGSNSTSTWPGSSSLLRPVGRALVGRP